MERVDNAVFPALQGRPYNHQIVGVAVALREASDPSVGIYQRNVVENGRVLGDE